MALAFFLPRFQAWGSITDAIAPSHRKALATILPVLTSTIMVKKDVRPEVLHHENYRQSVASVRSCWQLDAVGFGDKILATF